MRSRFGFRLKNFAQSEGFSSVTASIIFLLILTAAFFVANTKNQERTQSSSFNSTNSTSTSVSNKEPVGGKGQTEVLSPSSAVSYTRPTPILSAPRSSACNIKNVKRVAEGTQARLSPNGNLIVFGKKILVKGLLKTLEIFTMTPDGNNVKCLTCGKNIPGTASLTYKGQAAWHPSGNYIVFLAINNHGSIFKFADFPGVGANVDVYIMTADGEKYWQITDYPANWGVLFPAFSNDGAKLSWAEEYSCSRLSCPEPHRTDGPPCCTLGGKIEDNMKRNTGEELGNWQIKTTNLSFGGPNGLSWAEPESVPVNHYGKRMLESAGFTPNDNGFIFESVEISESNNHALCADVYTSNLKGDFSSFKRLTKSPLSHEENAAYSPDGMKIAHTSGPAVGIFYKTDMYLMDADKSGLPLEQEQKLTYFNDPAHLCKKGEVACYDGYFHIVGDPSWSPDGKRLLFWSWDGKDDDAKIEKYNVNFCDGRDVESALKMAVSQFLHQPDFAGNTYMIEFEGACGKQAR